MESGAHWVAREWMAWRGPAEDAKVALHAGSESFPLTRERSGLPDAVKARFPHLAAHAAYRLPPNAVEAARRLLREQIHVTRGASEKTGVQIAGVLDDLFRYEGPLGVWFHEGAPTLRLWAPTARNVTMILSGSRVAMSLDENSGVWTVHGRSEWRDQFYQYEVEVFVPTTGRIERNLVTDPYSLSLSTNSRFSQIVDLGDARLKPDGWDSLVKRELANPVDAVIYELHIRDFSISDLSVPEEHRGTYLAFMHRDSNGMRHLRRLAEAGLTHVHLLPAFDFTSVNDVRREHRDPGDLNRFPPDSPEQQAAIARIKEIDGFNWGYDPWHYTAPEGSYSTDPEGARRIFEFRLMVKSLAEIGLRLVMDVVYNHTHAAGQHELSVLDRIVPGYYHRLNDAGAVETSSCCPNTASEHFMMEKLMIDSLATWATAYKVDGFRFDLMGHHMKSNMVKVRDALPRSLLYGEAWNFGEVANNARGVNASQANIAGTGIGAFNDRLRDALRGGGAFTGLQEQGFVTGLADNPSQRDRLVHLTALVKTGLSASIRATGLAGYAAQPQEAVNYAAAHDNETLFDAIQLKTARDLPMAERVRMNNLAVSIVMLAQGIPFFHAGDEILRSKSLDRNSYNSGDWFNRIDWTLQSNTFGSGLPMASENQQHWPVMRPLLADPSLRPSREHMQRALEHFCEMLVIRKSSPVFRLTEATAILRSVRFHDAEPGVIAMTIGDAVLIIFNAHGGEKTVAVPAAAPLRLVLHAVQRQSTDPLLREVRHDSGSAKFTVPRRTTAVFVVQ